MSSGEILEDTSGWAGSNCSSRSGKTSVSVGSAVFSPVSNSPLRYERGMGHHIAGMETGDRSGVKPEIPGTLCCVMGAH